MKPNRPGSSCQIAEARRSLEIVMQSAAQQSSPNCPPQVSASPHPLCGRHFRVASYVAWTQEARKHGANASSPREPCQLSDTPARPMRICDVAFT
ncbi:hypothetical protein CC86DRAFT_372968 [Ophiobolus disseminans]|uniref:Uncharacterized protein n=1 Tax=Ophiobolus disseminans TaxID=1469910 RepID=A0A6A6ZNV3_9PLEO|nr:hypothetical protein CC86DRAFT_372968 [Ophiobolus disseminans]